ncbi:MAG: hypothetical protein LBI18_12865 [Planctomycetaceae bacterium]|jgi:hypothetical protein|nr:hypothetical protein [Planctomycetaceae bacterium]
MEEFYNTFVHEANINEKDMEIVKNVLMALSQCLKVDLQYLRASAIPDDIYHKIPLWHDCDIVEFLLDLSITLKFDLDSISMHNFPRLFSYKFFGITIFPGAKTLGNWVHSLIYCWMKVNGISVLPHEF